MGDVINSKIPSIIWKIAASGKLKYSNSKDGQGLFEYRLFGKTIYKSKDLRTRLKEVKSIAQDNKNPIIYFKINRIARYTHRCIQHWVKIAEELGADYYFVCDNPFLEMFVLERCQFSSANVKFIASMRSSLKKQVANFSNDSWRNATYAHLTPFYHAKMNDYKRFWCIDADDTMFLLKHEKAVEVLQAAEKYADSCGKDIVSLDMHYSRSRGKHWSLGVVYVSGQTDFCSIFDSVQSKDWTSKLNMYETAENLDWYFTYLKRENNDIEVDQFYVDNAYFVHWGDFLLNPIASSVYSWSNDQVRYRVIADLFENADIGVLPMIGGHRIDIGLTGAEGPVFWCDSVSELNSMKLNQKELWGIQEQF